MTSQEGPQKGVVRRYTDGFVRGGGGPTPQLHLDRLGEVTAP